MFELLHILEKSWLLECVQVEYTKIHEWRREIQCSDSIWVDG